MQSQMLGKCKVWPTREHLE